MCTTSVPRSRRSTTKANEKRGTLTLSSLFSGHYSVQPAAHVKMTGVEVNIGKHTCISILKENMLYVQGKNAANIKVFKVIFDNSDVTYLQEKYKF